MAEKNVMDPALVKKMLEMYADDPETASIIKQMEMANQMRTKMAGESKNVFGAIAEGMQGYQAGMQQQQMAEALKGLKSRIMQGRKDAYSGMFPDEQQPGMMPPDYGMQGQ